MNKEHTKMPQFGRRPVLPLGSGAPGGTRCIELQIPDSDEAVRQLFGVLRLLTFWKSFERDAGHGGTAWAQAWRDALAATGGGATCGGSVEQTIIEYDDNCGLKWSYDGGATWTNAALASCADAEIADKIRFTTVDGGLRVSLDGGEEYHEIYNAVDIADTEIADKIRFAVVSSQLRVSLDGGEEYGTIYDAKAIADTEIADKIRFMQDGNTLKVSLVGGEEYGTIYEPTLPETVLFRQVGSCAGTGEKTHLEASTDGGDTYSTIYDDYDCVVNLVNRLLVGSEEEYHHPQPGECKTLHVTLTANQRWLFPYAMNAGDTIHISTFAGTWNDGTPQWYCGDGAPFEFNSCFAAGKSHSASDPLPAAYHMQPIGLLDNVTYFDPVAAVYTIPVDTINAVLEFMANDETLVDNNGIVSFDIEYCTGGVGWTHEFNFMDGLLHGWTINYGYGTPTAGVGIATAYAYSHPIAAPTRHFSPTVSLYKMQAYGWQHGGVYGGHVFEIGVNALAPVYKTLAQMGEDTLQLLEWSVSPGSPVAVSDIYAQLITAYNQGNVGYGAITSIVLYGPSGSDPFSGD